MYNKLVKNSVFYTIAGILPQLINFLLLPLFTRYLSPEDFAVLALVTVFSSLIGIVFSFQLQSGISRFMAQYYTDQERAGRLFSGMLFLLSLILMLCGFLLEFFGERLVALFFSNENLTYRPLFQIGVWTVLFSTFQSACQALVRVQEFAKQFLQYNFIYVILNAGLSLIAVVYLKLGILGVLGGTLIATVIVAALFLYSVRGWLQIAFPVGDIINSVKYSAPLIPHAIAGYLFMYSDRLILEKHVPLAAIGIYALADRFAALMKLLVNSFNDAYSPHFMKKAETDPAAAKEEAGSVIRWWWAVYISFLYGIVLFSKELLLVMAEERFYPAADLISILAGAYLFRGLYCFAINGVFFVKKSWLIASVTIVAGVTNVLLNIMLVPHFGIYGAAWTTVLSFFLTFALSYLINLYVFPILFPWKSIFTGAVVFIVGLSGYYAIKVMSLALLPGLAFKMLLFMGFVVLIYFTFGDKTNVSPFVSRLIDRIYRKL